MDQDAEQRTSFAALCDGFRALSTPDDIFGILLAHNLYRA